LQALAYRFGITKPKYPYLNQDRPVDASHPDVYVDRNRCILCGRCAQASAQIDGKMVFGYEGRGIDMRVTVDSAADLVDTDLSGTDVAVESCPTGCLVRKRQAYRTPVGQRPYDKAPIGAKIETARKG
jgi:[NiFe] hydrogenase diaphorase moiety small subunit